MRIFEAAIRRDITKNLGNYENDKRGCELRAQFAEGEDIGVALAALQALVDQQLGVAPAAKVETKTEAKAPKKEAAPKAAPAAPVADAAAIVSEPAKAAPAAVASAADIVSEPVAGNASATTVAGNGSVDEATVTKIIAAAARNPKIGPEKVKAILAELGVKLTAQLTAEQRVIVKNKIEALG